MAGSRVLAATGAPTTTKEKQSVIQQERIDDSLSGMPLVEDPGLDEIALSAAPGDLSDLVDPDAIQGTRFTGPILSGAMEDGAAGTCLLSKRAKVSSATGSFSIPVKFPASTILISVVLQLQQTFNGVTPKLNFGTTLNGTDIASIDLSVAPTQVNQNLATILTSSWTIYVSLVNGGSTHGKATGIITYSVPAAARPS